MNQKSYPFTNIRATSLSEFWGDKYDQNIYLWNGALHTKTLKEIERDRNNIAKDIFHEREEFEKAIKNCKELYEKYLRLLAKRLNDYHKIEVSLDFWKISFGYWLFRHICVVYEKYAYLSQLDINKTSIKLLDKKSFNTPYDSIEYLELFGHDIGVQQLVSEYYNLFSSETFESIIKSYKPINSDFIPKPKNSKKAIRIKLPNIIKEIIFTVLQPKIVLLFTYYDSKYLKGILKRTKGKLFPIDLPKVEREISESNIEIRKSIFSFNSDNSFEQYLNNSFIHGLPSIFLENFKSHYDQYWEHVNKSKFKKILSEGWFGRNNVSIYCAIANELGREVIFQEHASSCSLVNHSFKWFYLTFKNTLITTGWGESSKYVIAGGFLAKRPQPYNFNNEANSILYVSQSATPFLLEFSWHPYNLNFVNTLHATQKIIELIPDELLKNFKYRPRKDITLWNTSDTLKLKEHDKIKIDNEAFHDSILKSRIVILDHFSTVITELILSGVPFLILINPHTEISDQAKSAINRLVKLEVVHYKPESLVKKLLEVYDETEIWWHNNEVKDGILNFKNAFLGEPSNTYNFIDKII